jgi:hypothetical protein
MKASRGTLSVCVSPKWFSMKAVMSPASMITSRSPRARSSSALPAPVASIERLMSVPSGRRYS